MKQLNKKQVKPVERYSQALTVYKAMDFQYTHKSYIEFEKKTYPSNAC